MQKAQCRMRHILTDLFASQALPEFVTLASFSLVDITTLYAVSSYPAMSAQNLLFIRQGIGTFFCKVLFLLQQKGSKPAHKVR